MMKTYNLTLKKVLIVLGLGVALLMLSTTSPQIALGAPTQAASVVEQLIDATDGQVIISNESVTGLVNSVRVPAGLRLPASGANAEAKSADFLSNYGSLFGLADTSQIILVDTVVDSIGYTHMIWEQHVNDVPVFGGVFRTHFNAEGDMTSANGTIIPKINVSDKGIMSADAAADSAIAALLAPRAVLFGSADQSHSLTVANNALYLYHNGLLQGASGQVQLAYYVEVVGSNVREFFFVDAHNGAVIERFSGIHTAIDREVSESSLANVIWSEGDAWPPTGTAQQIEDWGNERDGALETYNTINNMVGYASYDGADATMRTVNNDPGISCPNANWNGISTNYCSGVTGDDTVAHEWGHAYTEYTHGLIYAWQSGALNESYSDIWGEIVDLINGRGTDAPGGIRSTDGCSNYGAGSNDDDSYRWLSGEDDPAFSGAIRDMWTPTCYGDPGKVSDTEYHCAASDGGGVHTNSGVPNHAFALIVDGGTYNGQTISGIGLDKAAYIYWRAQSVYQSAATDFPGHATALATSCSDLVGNASLTMLSATSTAGGALPAITTADCAEVDKAIVAVEFNTPPTQCNFEAAFTTAPALCDGQGTGVVESISLQDWEGGIGAWTFDTHDVALPSTFTNPDWTIVGSLPAGEAGSAMYVEDSVNRGACTATDTVAGALNLDSPAIMIPAGADVPRVSVDHFVSTESGWDGGNLKISVNGGAFTVVPDSAFEVNGYFAPGAINGGGNDNPLAGEEAWTGGGEGSLASGWGQSQVNLTGIAAAGDSIVLRFDMGLDGCNGVDGWYVDEVQVYSCEDEVTGGMCGNSILEAGEMCDDGNTANSDGCSDTCQVESGWYCEDPTPGSAGGNLFADGSFEAGTPNPSWDEASTNFGSPICSAGSCGTGSGTGPSDGAFWVWMGGIGAFEEGGVTQTVTIPTGATDMTFDLEIPVACDSGADFMEVLVDGTQLMLVDGTSNLCGVVGYTSQTIDISAYADDGTHVVSFHSIINANNGGGTNFFVDNVMISDGNAIDPTPSTCAMIVDDLVCNGGVVAFEGGIPSTWTTLANGGPVDWGFTDDATLCGTSNLTPGSGLAACADADLTNGAGDPYDAELRTNSFDLSSFDATDVITLTYSAAYRDIPTRDDLFDVDVSTDGGTSWTNEVTWGNGDDHYAPGVGVTVNLSSYIGNADVMVRYRFYGEGWDWYAQVDDVSLTCLTALAVELTSSHAPDPVTPSNASSLAVLTTMLAGLSLFAWKRRKQVD